MKDSHNLNIKERELSLHTNHSIFSGYGSTNSINGLTDGPTDHSSELKSIERRSV